MYVVANTFVLLLLVAIQAVAVWEVVDSLLVRIAAIVILLVANAFLVERVLSARINALVDYVKGRRGDGSSG